MYLWDYNRKTLRKIDKIRIIILELQINYGLYLSDRIRIKLSEVKKYWKQLNLEPERRKLFQLFLWE